MNIAFFLTPRQEVKSLYDDNTFRKGMDLMTREGFAVVPVTTRDNRYLGVVSATDFLIHTYDGDIDEEGNIKTRSAKDVYIRDIMKTSKYLPVSIFADFSELADKITTQNFVPVVDSTGAFIGIVTRTSYLEYYGKHIKETEK